MLARGHGRHRARQLPVWHFGQEHSPVGARQRLRAAYPRPGLGPASPVSREGLGALRWHQQVDGATSGTTAKASSSATEMFSRRAISRSAGIDRLMWALRYIVWVTKGDGVGSLPAMR